MFSTTNITGNERIVAQEYANRIGGDAQLQQVLKVLLDDEAEELSELQSDYENLKANKEALESEHQQLQEKYEKLHAHWLSIGGDLV